MAELTQEEAWAAGAVRVPEDIILDVYEATNDGRPTGWPKFFDRTGEVWAETGERHDGDVVMMPGSDWVPMLRRDVQAFWGPLVAEEAYSEYLSARHWHAAVAYAAVMATFESPHPLLGGDPTPAQWISPRIRHLTCGRAPQGRGRPIASQVQGRGGLSRVAGGHRGATQCRVVKRD